MLTLTAGFAVVMTAAVAVTADPNGGRLSPGMWAVLGVLFLVWSISAGRLVWRINGQDAGALPVLPDPGDMAVLIRARSLAAMVMRSWPVLDVLGHPRDPVPMLEDALRILHSTLADRQALRTAGRRLAGATSSVAGIGEAVVDRRRLILERVRCRDAEVADVIARLAALAAVCAGHRGQMASLARANQLVTEADEVLCQADARQAAACTGTLAEVADRTTAVVRAYWELASASVPRSRSRLEG